MTHKIAILPGDGIGTEIIAQASKVPCSALDLKFETETAPWAAPAYEASGHPLPEATLNLARADAVLFGASATGSTTSSSARCARSRPSSAAQEPRPVRQLPPGDLLRAAHACLEPQARAGGGAGHPDHPRAHRRHLLRPAARPPRIARRRLPGAPKAFDTMRYSRPEIERIAHVAFQAAPSNKEGDQRRQGQRAGNLPVLEGRGHRGACAVSGRRARAPVRRQRGDAARSRRRRFDVLVTGNMFGDILSDEAAMLTGSIGMLPSASLNEQGGPVRAQPRQRARHRR